MKNKLEKIHLSIDNETKCYVSYTDYKKMKQSYEEKLRSKSEKKKYKIGDEVTWCDLDWYIIKIIENEQKVVLMSKEVFEPMTYSDSNSNDYAESNVKEYLEECFINKLDKSKLIEMRTNYDEDKFVTTRVRIPTLRDIEALPMTIRNCGSYYWTMTGSYAKSEDCSSAWVFLVDTTGNLTGTYVSNTGIGLRPVITLSTKEL